MEKIKEAIEDFKGLSTKEKLYLLLPYVMAVLFFCRVAELFRLCNGSAIKMLKNLEYLYKSFPRFKLTDLLFGIPTGLIIVSYIRWNNKINRKNTKPGAEYGDAKWGNEKDIKPYVDADPFNNIILSKTERLTMQPKMKLFELNRNKNVIVYGSSGSGKTFSFVKPNLMQCHSSYVVTDPKGYILRIQRKYVIKK